MNEGSFILEKTFVISQENLVILTCAVGPMRLCMCVRTSFPGKKAANRRERERERETRQQLHSHRANNCAPISTSAAAVNKPQAAITRVDFYDKIIARAI